MNSTYKGFFKSLWDLRQGDPLSFYLFIFIKEILSKILKRDFEEGLIGNFYHPRGAPLTSHILYADELVVFANGRRSLKRQLKTLEVYES